MADSKDQASAKTDAKAAEQKPQRADATGAAQAPVSTSATTAAGNDVPVEEVGGKVAGGRARTDRRVGQSFAAGERVDGDTLAEVPSYAEREAWPAEPPVHADPTATKSYGPSGTPLPADAVQGQLDRLRQGIPEVPKPAEKTVLHDTPGGYQVTPEGMEPEDVGPRAVVGPYEPRSAREAG